MAANELWGMNSVKSNFLAWCLAVVWVSGVWAEEPAPAYARQEDVLFAEEHGVGLLMDVFTPQEHPNGRAIVDVVSGSWHSNRGKLRDHERAQVFDILCRRGYTVFAIRPGSISRFSAFDMVHHVELGIRRVKRESATYKIDPLQLGLMGASAGGHLACLTAVTNGKTLPGDNASVAAVVAFFPPTDFLDWGGGKFDPRGDDPLADLARRLAFRDGVAGMTDAEIEQRLIALSPARRVTAQAPPFFLLHGGLDLMVPLQQSKTMLAALQAQQVPAELVIKKGGGHPWPTIHEEVVTLADWFDRQLRVAAAADAPLSPAP